MQCSRDRNDIVVRDDDDNDVDDNGAADDNNRCFTMVIVMGWL
jgi:hypothetical protein